MFGDGKATDFVGFPRLRCLFAHSCHGKATDSSNFSYFRCLFGFLPVLKATDFAGFPCFRCLLGFLPALKATDFAGFPRLHCLFAHSCPITKSCHFVDFSIAKAAARHLFLYLYILLVFVPTDDARIQVDVDLFDLLVFFQPVDTEFAVDSAHLVTAPRCFIEAWVIAVDPGDAGADFFDDAKCTRAICRKRCSCETIQRIVCHVNVVMKQLLHKGSTFLSLTENLRFWLRSIYLREMRKSSPPLTSAIPLCRNICRTFFEKWKFLPNGNFCVTVRKFIF